MVKVLEKDDENRSRDAKGGDKNDPQVLERHFVVVFKLFHPPDVAHENVQEGVVSEGNLCNEVLC